MSAQCWWLTFPHCKHESCGPEVVLLPHVVATRYFWIMVLAEATEGGEGRLIRIIVSTSGGKLLPFEGGECPVLLIAIQCLAHLLSGCTKLEAQGLPLLMTSFGYPAAAEAKLCQF